MLKVKHVITLKNTSPATVKAVKAEIDRIRHTKNQSRISRFHDGEVLDIHNCSIASQMSEK
jgi:hypothetical protein